MSSQSALPDHWIMRLFGELRCHYGASFDRTWAAPEGADINAHAEAVRRTWARELGGFASNPAALAHALHNLPPHVPSLPEFKALCLRRPEPTPPALPAPPADPRRVAEALARVRAVQGRSPQAWARELQDRELLHGGSLAYGKRMTAAQKTMWRKTLPQTAAHTEPGRRPGAPNVPVERRSQDDRA